MQIRLLGMSQRRHLPYIPADFLHETFPVSVGADPAYADGSGTSVVRYEIPLSAFTGRNVTNHCDSVFSVDTAVLLE